MDLEKNKIIYDLLMFQYNFNGGHLHGENVV